MTDDLKPCPFCGETDHSASNRAYWEIVCDSDQCGGSQSGDSEFEAIDAWNKRIEQQLL